MVEQWSGRARLLEVQQEVRLVPTVSRRMFPDQQPIVLRLAPEQLVPESDSAVRPMAPVRGGRARC